MITNNADVGARKANMILKILQRFKIQIARFATAILLAIEHQVPVHLEERHGAPLEFGALAARGLRFHLFQYIQNP